MPLGTSAAWGRHDLYKVGKGLKDLSVLDQHVKSIHVVREQPRGHGKMAELREICPVSAGVPKDELMDSHTVSRGASGRLEEATLIEQHGLRRLRHVHCANLGPA